MIFLIVTVFFMIFCKTYFFAVTAALCAPLLLHIPRQQDHQRWGQNFFLSWAFFFSGKRWGQNFFSFLGIFSLCCDQVDDEGGNQVQKDKSNLVEIWAKTSMNILY